MKILFNASTNNKGGALQTASNFIKEILKINDKKTTWFFMISPQIHNELKSFNMSTEDMIIIETSPSKNKEMRKKLLEIENKIAPDLVYTMSGPAYVKFRSTHIMGCTHPYITNADLESYMILKNPMTIFLTFLKTVFQAYYFRKADYWIFQTDYSRKNFVRRMRINDNKTFTVSNTCGEHYLQAAKKSNENRIENKKKINIFVPSAAYPHKNLDIIPHVAYHMKQHFSSNKSKYIINFILTLPQDSTEMKHIFANADKLNVKEMIMNKGPFRLSEGPGLYAQADILFLPTILEVFSGAFAEAMAMRIPIVTTNKFFIVDVCKNGALYFEPRNDKEASRQIINLIENPKFKDKLVNNASIVFKTIPTIEERTKKIVKILNTIA